MPILTHEAVLRGYIECALWSSSVEEDYGAAHDMPYDTGLDSAGFTVDDINDAALREMRADVDAFMEAADPEDLSPLDDEQIGHDFWLTRNRHGAGFWDRGLGTAGERLSDIARSFGESTLYIGDDEIVYVG